jgi:hypothetical protein
MGSLSGRILVGVLVPALAVWGRWRLRNAGRRLSGGWRGERQRSSCGTDGVEVSPEAVVGWEAGSGTRHSVPSGDVEAICYWDRGRSALEGAGLGLLAGAAAGAVYLAVVVAPECEAELVPLCVGFLAAYGAILGAPVGIVGGLFIGAVRGSQICVRFASDGSP